MASKATKPKEAAAPAAVEPKDDLVYITIPYIEGQAPEQTVIVNGRATVIKKGVPVMVKRNVANVVIRSNQQAMIAAANQEKYKLQKMDL